MAPSDGTETRPPYGQAPYRPPSSDSKEPPSDTKTPPEPAAGGSHEQRPHGAQNDNNSRGACGAEPGPEPGSKRFILQRFTIYNLASTMFIVGSNARESLFRIMEIAADKDAARPPQLLEIRSYFYTRNDMAGLLEGLNELVEGGIHKVAQAYGLAGLIRFTREYYLLVVTKCSQVAVVGGHYLYHVDETKLVPLSLAYRRPDKYSDEERLLLIFKYLDLGRTFYFSYTYDITNSLQHNCMAQRRGGGRAAAGGHNARFMWNSLLLEPVLTQPEIAAFEWFQPLVHGFIDQANVLIYGRKIYITIIARRSRHFAGARFLKRGANDRGNVANEVETEQIVLDMLTSSFHDPAHGVYASPRHTSFVQHRGSIPLCWTQDLNRLPKPPIEIHLSDPFYQSSALHFNNLFRRYGLPVVVLNLIKTKEKQPRELKLNRHFESCVAYLNQFLPRALRLQYHSFDMSKHLRKNLDVITPLQQIARNAVQQTGFFHNGRDLRSTRLQRGVVRTNCIDCLDRTNAAQFIIFKEALSHQLQSLGLIASATDLDYDSDLINILTEMFHDHGDTIAVQYGGSNLVNTMDSYRRINQWSSHTRDVLNSIKRIYSNSFMDLIRQEAINLFLGNYVYHPRKLKLWELQNDFYLHNTLMLLPLLEKPSYMHWYNAKYLQDTRGLLQDRPDVLPEPQRRPDAAADSSDNWFNECYGQRKFESFGDLFQFNMNSNVRYFPSNLNSTPKNFDYSPFESRKPFFKKKAGESGDGLDGMRPIDEADEPQDNAHLQDHKRLENGRLEGKVSVRVSRLLSSKPVGERNLSITKAPSSRQHLSEPANVVLAEQLAPGNWVRGSGPAHPHSLYKEVQVSEADMHVYSSQFLPPKMPPLHFESIAPTFRTSQADSELYFKLTTTVMPNESFLNEESLSAMDREIYAQYVRASLNEVY
ncbi:hypothetical protein METBIDRAFT_29724 [Metschnikowia bicuspidata var. bicuspidata NRRL YB-4993]|uniref:SAC domain-containing protein n=1 Tax=Metschnikowia bicuspidata var. bicuspidata NRRL YB-4993 TaxID=869754 RepID=A0A1A0HH48_9ASCO|nr:hypothetical protein METBIDRAFT_29724 [Metschnikowia bicuspidata var. bicuspidata NRRL YB-4993]OBA23202.1 hypothetical protein METBIDRAFT_29724 [Metschnikowia bicuspidata var. bicuspidata NRRL YB-4993]